MSERYRNEAQQRLLRVVMVLFGHVVNGLAPSAIAREVSCSNAVMTRDLANLSLAGLVEKDEATGHYRLTPRLPQQCFKVLAEIDRADRRLAEVKNRFTRNPD
jgi:DNA-binding IclR family transcriptional regulator